MIFYDTKKSCINYVFNEMVGGASSLPARLMYPLADQCL